MKQLLVSLLFIVLLGSCYHEVKQEPVKPERLLSEDSMVIVLTEIQLADGALTLMNYNHITKTDEKKRYYAYIYKKFNLTPELLKQNIEYYNTDPAKMIAIYDKVLEKLSFLQGELTIELKKEEKARQDSINSVDTTVYVRSSMSGYRTDTIISPPWQTNKQ